MNHKVAGVGVGVIIVREQKLLLQRRIGSHGEGTWSCPGGHIDLGESIEDCAIRETREEVGVKIAGGQFFCITNDLFPKEGRQYITVWVRGEYRSGEPTIRASKEVAEVGWFAWDRLPAPLFLPLLNLVRGDSYPRDAFVRLVAGVAPLAHVAQ